MYYFFCAGDPSEGHGSATASVAPAPRGPQWNYVWVAWPWTIEQDIFAQFGADIEVVARGGAVSARLAQEIERLKLAALDESAGEGYHRATNYEHIRAAAASSTTLKRSTRLKQCLEQAKNMQVNYGERGKMVSRHEWRCWKRILQTSHRSRWRNVREKGKTAFCKLYGEHANWEEDWTSIMNKMPIETEQVGAAESMLEQCQREYLMTVLDRGYYSVPQTAQVTPEAATE